jgi:hypothetical protein
MLQSSRVRTSLKKPIRGRGVRVVLALLLGAASMVGVSWSLALLVDGSFRTSHPASRGFSWEVAAGWIPTPAGETNIDLQQVTRARRWGTDIACAQGPVINGQPFGSLHDLVEGTSFAEEMKAKFDSGEAVCAWWRADGWPLPAFSAEARWRPRGEDYVWPVIGGVLMGSKNVGVDDGVRILPLRPIWSGIVVDTVFFAAVWWALLSLPRVRPALRRRQGRCARCGYALHPSQERCSECGEASPPFVVRPSVVRQARKRSTIGSVVQSVVLYGLLGAMMSYVMVWIVCASPRLSGVGTGPQKIGWSALDEPHTEWQVGVTSTWISDGVVSGRACDPSGDGAASKRARADLSADEAIPVWARAVLGNTDPSLAKQGLPEEVYGSLDAVARIGWPCRSLVLTYWMAYSSTNSAQPAVSQSGLKGAWQLTGWSGFNPRQWVAVPPILPWKPIWLGLLVNSAFYGVALFAGVRIGQGVLRTLRDRARRQRGACARCGYDLRGAPSGACPECGTAADL